MSVVSGIGNTVPLKSSDARTAARVTRPTNLSLSERWVRTNLLTEDFAPLFSPPWVLPPLMSKVDRLGYHHLLSLPILSSVDFSWNFQHKYFWLSNIQLRITDFVKISTGLYRSCAALADYSGTFDLILFEAVNLEFIVEKVWFGLVWIDGLEKQTR